MLEGVGNPAVAALLLAKSAQAAERGIELTIRRRFLSCHRTPPPTSELVTIVGNLVDNAFDVLVASADGGRGTVART